MSILLKRALVLIATLTLAGMAVGCDKKSSSPGDEPGLEGSTAFGDQAANEPGQVIDPMNDQANMEQPGESPMPADQMGGGPSDDMGATPNDEQAAGDMAQGQDESASTDLAGDQAEDSRIEQTREKVSSSLGIPSTAVVIAAADEQKLMNAEDEVELEARVTSSTIEKYLGQVDAEELDDKQQAAYQELQTSLTTLDQDIDQFAMADADQRDNMKSQVEEHLKNIDKNWKTISDQIDLNQTATGGGPEDEGQSDFEEQPAPDSPDEEPLDQGSDEVQTY